MGSDEGGGEEGYSPRLTSAHGAPVLRAQVTLEWHGGQTAR
jgi:hypothetical protein